MRKNPLLFKLEEYRYLHQIYLRNVERGKMSEIIRKKQGVGLQKKEILFIKKKFTEWKEGNKEVYHQWTFDDRA